MGFSRRAGFGFEGERGRLEERRVCHCCEKAEQEIFVSGGPGGILHFKFYREGLWGVVSCRRLIGNGSKTIFCFKIQKYLFCLLTNNFISLQNTFSKLKSKNIFHNYYQIYPILGQKKRCMHICFILLCISITSIENKVIESLMAF